MVHIESDGKPAYKERYDWVGDFCDHDGIVKAWIFKDGTHFSIDRNGERIGSH